MSDMKRHKAPEQSVFIEAWGSQQNHERKTKTDRLCVIRKIPKISWFFIQKKHVLSFKHPGVIQVSGWRHQWCFNLDRGNQIHRNCSRCSQKLDMFGVRFGFRPTWLHDNQSSNQLYIPSLKLTYPMKIPIFPGKYHQNDGFSWAMLVSGRVVDIPLWVVFPKGKLVQVPRIRSMLSAAHCIDWNHMFAYILCGQDLIPILLNHMSNEKKPGFFRVYRELYYPDMWGL